MSNIDLIDRDFEVPDSNDDNSVEDAEERNAGKKRQKTKEQLKVRRAIEDHLDKKRYRKELDDFDDEDFSLV